MDRTAEQPTTDKHGWTQIGDWKGRAVSPRPPGSNNPTAVFSPRRKARQENYEKHEAGQRPSRKTGKFRNTGKSRDSQPRITQRGKAATKLIRTHELMKMERGISRKTGNARKQDRLRAIPEM
ncbi:MAG: hypothetical protein PHI39_11335, partial [Kiritimatiellae bacterium]|nr:hypothetical protein [Kiritimatiellia bacterium]